VSLSFSAGDERQTCEAGRKHYDTEVMGVKDAGSLNCPYDLSANLYLEILLANSDESVFFFS
jgi:hypothetical protein